MILKRGKNWFIVDGGTYPYQTLVCWEISPDRIKEILLGLKVDISGAEEIIKNVSGAGQTFWLKDKKIVLWLKHKPENIGHFGVVVHEIFHVVRRHFKWIDIKLGEKSEEAFAYQIEYLTVQIMTEFLKENKKKKR